MLFGFNADEVFRIAIEIEENGKEFYEKAERKIALLVFMVVHVPRDSETGAFESHSDCMSVAELRWLWAAHNFAGVVREDNQRMRLEAQLI